MQHGHDDRLEAVNQDLHAFLEQQLGDLLGVVRAAESLARQVKATDDEVERKRGLQAVLADSGHAAHAQQVEREIDGLLTVREAYVAQLSDLSSGLHV